MAITDCTFTASSEIAKRKNTEHYNIKSPENDI